AHARPSADVADQQPDRERPELGHLGEAEAWTEGLQAEAQDDADQPGGDDADRQRTVVADDEDEDDADDEGHQLLIDEILEMPREVQLLAEEDDTDILEPADEGAQRQALDDGDGAWFVEIPDAERRHRIDDDCDAQADEDRHR